MTIEWKISDELIDYPNACELMEKRVDEIIQGKANEMVWLLEHPPLYTAGTSAKQSDLISANFPVYNTARGGQFTYHGPGQRVAYLMLDVKKRAVNNSAPDLRLFVKKLESWIIATLADFNIKGEVRDGRVGVWVNNKGRDEKIAALGIRVKKWVSYHGISINLDPNLSHFGGIIPCGISDAGVCSFESLGYTTRMEDLDIALKENFQKIFTAL